MRKGIDAVLGFLIRFAHETLGLSPNQISVFGLMLGMVAAALVLVGRIEAALGMLAASQIVDGLDGGVARRYGLQSKSGERLELVFDRACEFAFFLALAYVGLASVKIALLACTAILLISWIEPYSKFDPGFKRFMMYFGYAAGMIFGIRGFELALNVVFWANLGGFVVGTILVDYRFQREVDDQAILRRERETAAGIPQPPDDPPSFLSKLFS